MHIFVIDFGTKKKLAYQKLEKTRTQNGTDYSEGTSAEIDPLSCAAECEAASALNLAESQPQ